MSAETLTTYSLDVGKELRILTTDACEIKVTEGEVEWNGAQLANNSIYHILPNTWLSLYAVYNSQIEVVGSAQTYIGTSSVVEEYHDLHVKMSRNRLETKSLNEPAQVILVTGPIRSGKGSFALHLVNYAVRDGYTPLFVDLSLSTNLITVPGCVACTVASSTYSPSSQFDFNFNQPLVFCCGTTKYTEKQSLYAHYTKLISQYAMEKFESNTSVKQSGVIIRCPFTSLESLQEVIERFKVDIVYVLDSEHLYNTIATTTFTRSIGTTLVPKPSGIPLCTDYVGFVKRLEHRLVNNYFCGCNPETRLCPRSGFELGNEYKFVTIKAFKEITSGILPIGETQVRNPFDVEVVEVSANMKNEVYAILNCDEVSDVLKDVTNVLGFVIVEDVTPTVIDEKFAIVPKVRVPNPDISLPNLVLMQTGMKVEHEI
ncbi:ATP/GTP-binding protein [Entamoeba marina]